ncbi:hypothetical protein PMI42_03465 [Bradyrhizobium sp. YR681]|nr:hypothetical protein PMI42_03465 [Bradyrhizobium sp. YR681]
MTRRWISGAVSALFAIALSVQCAAAEVLFKNDRFELSGLGSRSSRSCTVSLAPTVAFNADLAPTLRLVTRGLDRVDLVVGEARLHAEIQLVQNNVRRPVSTRENIPVAELKNSELWKSIGSQKVFFLTARLTEDRGHASGRYERVNVEDIAEKLEQFCPFDAESLMADVSGRERFERFLSISQSDLTYVRWALQSAVAGSSSKPDSRASLSEADRDNLRKYTARNGLPVSRFLTAATARKLKEEGLALEPKPEAKAPEVPEEPRRVDFALINSVDEPIQIAFYDGDTRARVDPEESKIYRIDKGATGNYGVTCTPGQLICYGASVKSDPIGASWGTGRAGKDSCTNCCRRCGGAPVRQTFDLASSYTPTPTITWNIENATSRTLSVAFYSQTRHWGWPNWDKNWTMNKGNNSHTLNCIKNEKICYGAWVLGQAKGPHWGAGMYAKEACKGCCTSCDGGTYTARLVD